MVTDVRRLGTHDHVCWGYDDRFMVRRPLSAMGAYDRSVLDPGSLDQIAIMHPTATGPVTPFRLHASTTPGCAAAIGGELDDESAGRLVLDATELTFVDGERLATIAAHARRLAAILVLRTDQHVPCRLVRLMDRDDVRIEVPA